MLVEMAPIASLERIVIRPRRTTSGDVVAHGDLRMGRPKRETMEATPEIRSTHMLFAAQVEALRRSARTERSARRVGKPAEPIPR